MEEDEKLLHWVKTRGATKWTLCSETIHGRNGKQCREHWNNSKNPEVKKGSWTIEEDFLIMTFYNKYKGSWKKILLLFPKRTENSIKNRFFSQLRKITSIHIQSKDKKFSSKIKLETLLHYLDEATEKVKIKYLSHNNLNEAQLEEYLQEKEQIIINTKNKSSSESTIEKNKNSIVDTSEKTNQTKFENYDIELLEKEIYYKCDNIQDLFNFDDESFFNNKADSINNVFSDNIDTSFDNTDIDCFFCNQDIITNSNNQTNNSTTNSSKYISLMNKLIESEKKVQDAKIELNKFENNN